MTPAEPPPSRGQDSAVSPSLGSGNAARRTQEMEGGGTPRPESKSDLLAFGFTEFHRLSRQGERPEIHEWCDLFPTCRSSLRRMLEVQSHLGSQLDELVKGSWDESIDWPRAGEQREGFTIVRELARGAFARVYLATEPATGDRLVVLKCSQVGDAEARTMGRLSHPGIVPILSARRDEFADLTLVCMPYLGSATLEDVLDRVRTASAGSRPRKAVLILDAIRACAQPEDPSTPRADARLQQGSYTDGVLLLAVQLVETLAFLHTNGVCHRDLKPSNVLLDPSGKPLLLDFNLSDSEREAAAPVGGTLRYMAPEQLHAFLDKHPNTLDERADFYALAVMVYELLAGESPYGDLPSDALAAEQARILLERRAAGFRSFRQIAPDLERPVAAILDRCLALEVAERPGSAAELAAELSRQFTPARRLRRWLAARRRWVLATLGLLVVAFVVLASVWAVMPPYSQREYDRGRIAYRAGDFNAAEMHFDRALRAEPNDARFRFARGCARFQQSKYLSPEQVKFDPILEDLTSTEPGPADPRTLAVHAYVQIRNQKSPLAIRLYNRIEKSGNRSVMVLNNRAYAYMSISQWEKARSDLDRAVQLDPHCQAARYNRGLVAMNMRITRKIPAIPRQALQDLEQALQLGPRSSALYRDAAVLYALAAEDDPQQGQFERALSYLRQAIATGEAPAKFDQFPSLRDALKRPEFVVLLSSSLPQASPQPDLHLIDPVQMPD
ncbi:MAG TPA: protein kinase [Gemmataceae bacterium]|nr:protein kinase [Gemmataceae bacterium]